MKLKVLSLLCLASIVSCKQSAVLCNSNQIKISKCTSQTVYRGTEDAGVSQTIVVTFEMKNGSTITIDSIAYRGNVVASKPAMMQGRASGVFHQQVTPKKHPVLGENSALHCVNGSKSFWLTIDSIEVAQPVYMPQMQHGE